MVVSPAFAYVAMAVTPAARSTRKLADIVYEQLFRLIPGVEFVVLPVLKIMV